MGLLVAGCGNGDEDGGDATLPAATDVTGDGNGADVAAVSDEFFEDEYDLPIYPTTNEGLVSVPVSEQNGTRSITRTTPDSVEDVFAFYESIIDDAIGAMMENGVGTVVTERDGVTITVTIREANGETEINISAVG